MQTVVSTLTTLTTFPFKNAAGTLVTGKVNADFTKHVLKDGVVSAVAATVTEVTSLSGYYSTSLTPTAVGIWTVIVEYTADPMFAWISDPIEVITAAADPAALATAIAGVQATVDTIDGNVDVAVSTRATVAALISENLTVDAPSATDSDKTIIVGDSSALAWSSTGWPDLTAKTATFQAYKMITNTAVFASAKTVTITNAGAATQNLAITLAGTDTDDFVPGVLYRYEVNSTAGLLVSGSLAAREG